MSSTTFAKVLRNFIFCYMQINYRSRFFKGPTFLKQESNMLFYGMGSCLPLTIQHGEAMYSVFRIGTSIST